MSVFSARYGDAVAGWPSLDPNLGRGDGVAVNTLAVGSKGRVVVIGRNGDLVCCRNVSDLSTGCRRSTQKTSIGTRVARAPSVGFFLANSHGVAMFDADVCKTTATTRSLSPSVPSLGTVYDIHVLQTAVILATDVGVVAFANQDLSTPAWSVSQLCGTSAPDIGNTEPVFTVTCSASLCLALQPSILGAQICCRWQVGLSGRADRGHGRWSA